MNKPLQQNTTRPMKAFITGTDTAVGKTAITVALGISLQEQGLRVGVMKPIETGVEAIQQGGMDDGSRLGSILRPKLAADKICLYQFPEPIAPLAASRRAQRPIKLKQITSHYQELSRTHDVVLVEGAGGVMVPITPQETMRDLIGHLQLPCIVVSRFSLGAINHALLTLQALRDRDIEILAVVLNQSTPLSESPYEQLQIDSTIHLLNEFCKSPIVGPIAFEPRLGTEWKHGVTKLAKHPAIAELSERVTGKG